MTKLSMTSEDFEKWKNLIHSIIHSHFDWAFRRRESGEHWGFRRYIDMNDLFQAGCVGLLEAWNKYDDEHESGAVFTSFAYKFIYREIVSCIELNATPITLKNWRLIKHRSAKSQRRALTALGCSLFSETRVPNKRFEHNPIKEDERAKEQIQQIDQIDFERHCVSKLKDNMEPADFQLLIDRFSGASYKELGGRRKLSKTMMMNKVNELLVEAAAILYQESKSNE